jgi:uncharacterized membrane protein YhhN
MLSVSTICRFILLLLVVALQSRFASSTGFLVLLVFAVVAAGSVLSRLLRRSYVGFGKVGLVSFLLTSMVHKYIEVEFTSFSKL